MFFKPSNTDQLTAIWRNFQNQITHEGTMPDVESAYNQSYHLITQYAQQHHLRLPENYQHDATALKNALVGLLSQSGQQDIKAIEHAVTQLCYHFTTMQSNLTCQSRLHVTPERQSNIGFKF